ncbi:MAG: efflux RND transporter periplasmic adaptor subunit [Candidatus Azambacteria bacterium]|nr:efflux RND transporter periplasmic adaptor subunit [Candidatus Azambacteria bacterium]
MNKIIRILKKPSVWVIAVLVIGAVVWGVMRWEGKDVVYDTTAAKRADIERTVSVTGKVRPAENVELAFERSGRIAAVHAVVSGKVAAGTLLAEIEHADLSAQYAEGEAARAVQRAKLAEMKKGARTEDIEVSKVRVVTATQALADARINLSNVTQKATVDLEDDYDSTRAALVKSMNVALGSLFTLTDIQLKYYSGSDQQGTSIADAKATAVMLLLGAPGTGRWTNDALSARYGGVRQAIVIMQASPTHTNTESTLISAEKALASIKSALDAVPITATLTTTEAASLQTEKSNISGELVALAAKEQAIAVQKAANESAITTAQTSVHSAESALASAEAELVLKQSGATAEQIAAQEAAVAQADANMQSVNAQLAKAFLYAPIAGVVTRQDAKVGQIVGASVAVISLISELEFEIEARVPEADVAAVKIGDLATVTLDAYGNDVVFNARVVAIDPAETIVDGVATYKTTFAFLAKDARVKSGMTANIDVVTDRREGAVVVPRRAISKQGSDAFLRVLDSAGIVHEVKVLVGLIGSDGNAEIIEGIHEGDAVIISSPVQ